MAEKIIIHGRRVVGGVAEGVALVSHETIAGWGGVDMNGRIIDLHCDIAGEYIGGRVLVFQGAKGSSGWSGAFHMARSAGHAPAAMLFNVISTKSACGSVVTRAPAMTDFDIDPTSVIQTGDFVRVDADNCTVEVWPGGKDGKQC